VPFDFSQGRVHRYCKIPNTDIPPSEYQWILVYYIGICNVFVKPNWTAERREKLSFDKILMWHKQLLVQMSQDSHYKAMLMVLAKQQLLLPDKYF
jgi:hypothetical protein